MAVYVALLVVALSALVWFLLARRRGVSTSGRRVCVAPVVCARVRVLLLLLLLSLLLLLRARVRA